MATNPFFNQFTMTTEQQLHNDLVVEAIKIYGHNMYYLPRTAVNTDDVMNENSLNRFDSAIEIEIYIKNSDAFEGDGQLLSKFAGLEIRDQMTVNISKQSFVEYIKSANPSFSRPREGDAIYIPVLNVVYQIRKTKTDAVFYNHGKLNMYECILELFENQGEIFNTGVSAIDNLYPDRGNVADVDYDVEDNELDADNSPFQTGGNEFVDFTETDPFTESNV